MSDSAFFINVAPSNDRRDQTHFTADLEKYIDRTKAEFFRYTLITAGDKRLDPWVVAQKAMGRNPEFNPMVAVNPLHQHPFHIVKKISSLQFLYKNKIALNLIPGSFPHEMQALNDTLGFSDRLKRLNELAELVNEYSDKKVTGSLEGDFYQVRDAKIFPSMEDSIDLFYSGVPEVKDDKGMLVKGIKPMDQMQPAQNKKQGLLLGICARSTEVLAAEAMETLFPEDRKGHMIFEMILESFESSWSSWIKSYLKSTSTDDSEFNLRPMKNYWSSAPFVVGDYDKVAGLLKKYTEMGYGFFVVDFHPQDFSHVEECLKRFRKL